MAEPKLTGDKRLDKYFAKLPDRMQRRVIRPAVAAATAVLARNIRKNIKTMVSGESRSVRRGERGLAQNIKRKYWSVPSKGIIGYVVGADYGQAPHAHLVEYGHVVKKRGPTRYRGSGSNPKSGTTRSGKVKKTRPLPFQHRAMEESKAAMFQAQKAKLSQGLTKLYVSGA